MSFCTTLFKKLYSERILKSAEANSALYFSTDGVGVKRPPTTKFPFECTLPYTAIFPLIGGEYF